MARNVEGHWRHKSLKFLIIGRVAISKQKCVLWPNKDFFFFFFELHWHPDDTHVPGTPLIVRQYPL